MHLSASALLAFALLTPQQPASPVSASRPNWEQEAKARHDALIAHNGPGSDTALHDQLLAMRDRDQLARGFRNGQPIDKDQYRQVENLAEIDRQLTAELKQIFYAKGWPTIHLVGIDASNAALLILTHSPDHAFQHELLPQLESLSDSGKIDGSALATVVDKELVASGQLQRYGTQFKFLNGQMAMFAVEDPAHLDDRRAQIMLMPMDAYRSLLAEIYHLSVSSQIVNPATSPRK